MIKQLGLGMLLLPIIAFASEPFEKKWSGKYLGGNLGGVFHRAGFDSSHSAFSSWGGECQQKTSFASALIGGQLGIQKELESKLVLGFEGDYNYHFSQFATTQCVCEFDSSVYDRFKLFNRYQASAKGRLGYAYKHNLQPFFTAGVSFADLGLAYTNEVNNHYSHDQMRPGFVVGGGVDWAYSERWNLRLEYNYNQYKALSLNIPYVYDILDTGGMGKLKLSSNNIRAAINYWF